MALHTFTKYTGEVNTIAFQIERIKHYVASIGADAAMLELKAAGVAVNENSTLEEIAQAICSISIKNSTDASNGTTIAAGASTTLPAGYYLNGVEITAETLGEQKYGTATDPMLIKGATALGKEGPITGTLELDPNKILKTQEWTNASGSKVTGSIETKDKTSITGSETGVYDSDKLTVEVKRATTADGGTADVANSITIPAGYYANEIIIKPVVKDAAGNVEGTLNYGAKTISGDDTGGISFGTGTSVTYSPNGDGLDYYGDITVNKATYTEDTTTGELHVSKGGWINPNDYSGLDEGSYVTDATGANAVTISGGKAVINKKDHGYTPDTINATLPVSNAPAAAYNADAVNANEITVSGSVTLAADTYYGAATIPFSKKVSITGTEINYNSAKTTGKSYTSHNVNADKSYIDIAAGYLPETHIELDVKDAVATKVSVPTLKNGKYYVEYAITEGWTPGETFTVDLGKSTHSDQSNIALNATKNVYEATCTSTAGYTTGETVKINIGKSELSTSGISYDSANNKFVASATTTAGYTTGVSTNPISSFDVTVGTGATLTKASNTKSIAANTYFPTASSVTVSAVAGTLADGTKTTDKNVETGGVTTKLLDLSADTTFAAANNKYYTSFTVEVTDTIAALAAI